MARGCLSAGVAALLLGLTVLPGWAAPDKPSAGALLPRDSTEAGMFRGGVVYGNYCVTCHGMNADGNGRAARLYTPRPANLRMSDKNDQYFSLIIRKGGATAGRSEFMPAWDAELTEEQVRDLVVYLRSINMRQSN